MSGPARPTVVILDDDPTGTQTIRDLTVYARWDEASLAAALAEKPPAFFLLTNSRALSGAETRRLHAALGRTLVAAARAAGQDFLLVSRSDSTLRGHFPLEPETLAEALRAGGMEVSGVLLCPCFFEGRRFTKGGVHYLEDQGRLIPVGETEFARDATFGYRASDLCEWIEERSEGRVPSGRVARCDLSVLRGGRAEALLRDTESPYVVVDGMEEGDMRLAAQAVFAAHASGRRFVIRSAASLVQALCGQPGWPPLRPEALRDAGGSGGLVVVGSHVARTNAQLEALRSCPGTWVEFRVDADPACEQICAAKAVETALRRGETAVLYTSRTVAASGTPEEQLAFSAGVSRAVAGVVRRLAVRPRFLIAKGGITSCDVGILGLSAQRARVLGCAVPGAPVWQLGPESKFPGLPYIIFPGNVGQADTLARLVTDLTQG